MGAGFEFSAGGAVGGALAGAAVGAVVGGGWGAAIGGVIGLFGGGLLPAAIDAIDREINYDGAEWAAVDLQGINRW